MMCSTLSTSTAYCITERQLKSVWTTTFATLRCTNISPGIMPISCVAGTRLSAHPIHKNRGDCCLARVGKKSGSFAVMFSAQAWFCSSSRLRSFITLLRHAQRLAAHTQPAGRRYPRAGTASLEASMKRSVPCDSSLEWFACVDLAHALEVLLGNRAGEHHQRPGEVWTIKTAQLVDPHSERAHAPRQRSPPTVLARSQVHLP